VGSKNSLRLDELSFFITIIIHAIDAKEAVTTRFLSKARDPSYFITTGDTSPTRASNKGAFVG
jgi:hypothetical protein